MISKILFKATLPLAAVIGIASYGLYAAGGDPIAILQQVGGGFGSRVTDLADSAGSSLSIAGSKTKASLGRQDVQGQETLYRWRDAEGVTHFSNTPPSAGQRADSLQIDPNQNVMSATKAPAESVTGTESQVDNPMPGVAGILAPDVYPADLIEQFKQAQEAQQVRLP